MAVSPGRSVEEGPAIESDPIFRLRTLGPVDLRGPDDDPIDAVLHQPKRLAVLVYLAVAGPDGFVRRDTLLALFWPELPEDRARNALNKTVHFLRKELDGEAVVTRGSADVGTSPLLGCDAVAFERAIDDDRPEDAVARYDGPFLEGFHVSAGEEFEFWLDRERDRFDRLYATALRDLATREARAGELEASAAWWRRLVEHDPSNARAVLGLMEALEAVGERGAAIHHAEEHARVLRDELDAEPDPEVERFAARLREAPKPSERPAIGEVRHVLPSPATPLVGRGEERARLGALLADDGTRLVTLTGPGGTGKTRLAVAVASEMLDAYADGVYFVNLAPLTDAGLVGATIARTVGVRTDAKTPVAESLREGLGDRRCLIVLDSFEQVLPAADLVADVLGGTGRLTVLVTSRAVLQLRGEHVFPVPPLSVPETTAVRSLEETRAHDAVRLFVERARASRPEFELTEENHAAVGEICARLDGLPLAIELAAARVRLFGPSTILERLARSFELLRGGPRDLPDRQRTLRRTFDWSYDTLSERERRLFRHLCVFVGGCSLEAIAEVCYPDGESEEAILDEVTAMVDHSLLRRVETAAGEPRFEMLETIRAYGWQLLVEGDEAAEVRRRHAEHFLALAERAEEELAGRHQTAWLDRLEREHHNVQAVLDWALEGGRIELAVRLGSALWWFWWVRGHFTEMRWRLDQALAKRSQLPASLQANLLVASGAMASIDGDHERALARFQEAFAVEREEVGRREVVRVLRSMAIAVSRKGEYDRAIELLEEALALSREMDAPAEVASSLRGLAKMQLHRREYDRAVDLYERAREIGEGAGDRQAVAWALFGLSEVARHRGEVDRAADCLEEGLAICREIGSKPGTAYLLLAAGHVARYAGDLAEARACYVEALELLHELGNRRRSVLAVMGLAAVDVHEGELQRGVRLFSAVEPLAEDLGVRLAPVDREARETTTAKIRAELDPDELASMVAAGRRMGLDEAIALALGGDASAEAERAPTG